jgi:hypothetical protein
MIIHKKHRKLQLLAVLQAIVVFVNAQNLVINPSFEQHTQCPTQFSQINYCNSWYNGGTNSTCDYYSASGCTGNFSPPVIKPTSYIILYQQPLSGQSFAGFLPYFYGGNLREYLQGNFSSPLKSDELYYIEFYINATSQQEYFINNIAALISDTVFIDPNNPQNYTPQILPKATKIYKDTVKWMRINGYYTANGNEKFITIGNYTPYGQELKDSTTSIYKYASYFIDSVGVYEVTHLDNWNAGPDKYINYGDSVQIGNPNTDLSMFEWINSINDITYLNDSTEANPWSKPWQTTTYYVTKTQGTNVFKDTVTVHVTGGNGIAQYAGNNAQVNLYPNPANNNLQVTVSSKQILSLGIYDVLGNEVPIPKPSQREGGSRNIDVSNLIAGIYFIEVQTSEGILTRKVIIQH